MKYKTYEIAYVSGDSLKFIKVVACDLQAALADCNEAGFEVLSAKLV